MKPLSFSRRYNRKPRQGEEVRFKGRSGKVMRVDYNEDVVRIRFIDKMGGIRAIDLDEFEGNWTGRRWFIPDEDAVEDETEERNDVQKFFDWAYYCNEPDYIAGQLILRTDNQWKKDQARIDRLKLLSRYLSRDDFRHQILEAVINNEDDPGTD